MGHITFNLTPVGEVVKASKPGRVCKFKGCKCILSIYNYGKYCFLHTNKMILTGSQKTHRFWK